VQLSGCKRLLAGQQALGGLDQRDRRAERAVGLRHLDPNHSAAEHDQAAGDSARGRDFAVGPRPGLGQPRDRGHRGSAADRENHRFASFAEKLSNPYAALALESSMTSNQRDTAIRQPGNRP
jgi:hypothetical protein